MPIQFLNNTRARYSDGTGKPLAQGTVGVYVAGTSFATLATVWDTVTKDTELINPVTLDDAGEVEIWYDVEVDIRVKDSTGQVTDTALGLNPSSGESVTTGFNLATNGSFEIDSENDGQPDSWTIAAYSGSAIAITEDVVTDGTKALEFNTGAAATGGGLAVSSKFPVTEGSVCSFAWSFYATHATTLNAIAVEWYDEDSVLKDSIVLSNMPESGSVPTSWTSYTEEVTAPADATQGAIILGGIINTGSNLTSKAYFDGIKIIDFQNMVTLDGVQTVSNKTLEEVVHIIGYSTADLHITAGSDNLVLDSAIGSTATLLNYFQGTGGIFFGDGAAGSNANVSAAGVMTATEFVGEDLTLAGDVTATNIVATKVESAVEGTLYPLGDGVDGAKVISADEDLDADVIYQYSSLDIQSGFTLGVTQTDTAVLEIYVQGTCTIAGTIDLDGKGGVGAVAIAATAVDAADTLRGGSGGGGGNEAQAFNAGDGGDGMGSTGGIGGANGQPGGDASGAASLTKLVRSKRIGIMMPVGSGGYGAGGGAGASNNKGGDGGNGGGGLIIHCNELVLTGAINAKGTQGTNADNSSGGSGGGGEVTIIADTVTTSTGTIDVSGVAGLATGRAGGDGGDGYSVILTY